MITSAKKDWLQDIVRARVAKDLVLSLEPAGHGYSLRMNDSDKSISFPYYGPFWQTGRPDFGCATANLQSINLETADFSQLPMPGGVTTDPIVRSRVDGADFNYDVLGLTWWMLSRAEEIGRVDVYDVHGRFPAYASHAYQYDYLMRPIVDQWMATLQNLVCQLWPQADVPKPSYQVCLSHDIDRLSQYGLIDWQRWSILVLGDIVKRAKVKTAFTALASRWRHRTNLDPDDPFNNIDFLLDVSKENRLTAIYYFICGQTNRMRDADYRMEHPGILELLTKISERGHSIGLHPSFDTFLNPTTIRDEQHLLEQVCASSNIPISYQCRMHYLKFRVPETWRYLSAAGIQQDSSMGYADHVGFRCGTCHVFNAYDAVADQALPIQVRPLIAMDRTIFNTAYMGLQEPEAYELIKKLALSCATVDGNFELLWHNTSVCDEASKTFYGRLMSLLCTKDEPSMGSSSGAWAVEDAQ